ncbi:GNAT family N-acetyltransferase [bacterium]|nr:GNAT family N-acetyltransferase [bacterium]
MEIFQVQVEDLNEVHALGRKVFGDIAHSSLVIRQLWDQNHPFVWAIRNPNILGYCIGGIEAGTTTGHIMSLAVDPEARRQRIGFILTEKVMAEFVKYNVSEYKLVCSPTNTAAISLYESLGFKQGEIIQDYFGPGAHRLAMSRAV